MSRELQFREYYGHLAGGELARIALTDQLVPEFGMAWLKPPRGSRAHRWPRGDRHQKGDARRTVAER